MHDCPKGPARIWVVTLMDTSLPHPRVHQIEVHSPCSCDMADFVSTLDLPLVPAFMSVSERETIIT